MKTEVKLINSKVLERNMSISVYIPKGYENINLPVLYFLHGRGGNANILKELEMEKVADKLIENHSINPFIIVCPYIANIIDWQPKTIESNISNAIKTHWTSCYAETLEKINKNYKNPVYPKNGCPTSREFLLFLIEKYKNEHPKSNFKFYDNYEFFKNVL